MSITRRYAELVEDQARAKILGRLHNEWPRAQDCLLSVTGQSHLLESHTRFIDLPTAAYVESLNLL